MKFVNVKRSPCLWRNGKRAIHNASKAGAKPVPPAGNAKRI